MSSGFDLFTGAHKKLWIFLHVLCITLCFFFTLCSPSCSLQTSKKHQFLVISIILRSKRNCFWVDCSEDCLGKYLSFSILGFRGFRVLGFS
ncbi:hypothetical protein MANES_01G012425v8 [Manihot esculenta]|uniref:Uncharacterized protein n=1 Tax=Manihot esculenta TaxID=3983 RepID=A0ACB7I9U4_MANES|nr:hypothetical protein MANES_01G012425v8 [Manihot esculenta]